MSVQIYIDPQKITSKVQSVWDDKVLFPLSSQVLADCNEYVKIDQKTMMNSSYAHSQLEKGTLMWVTVYAKRQYWEIKTSRTPGRTWKWCETAKAKCKKDWAKIAEKLLKENL